MRGLGDLLRPAGRAVAWASAGGTVTVAAGIGLMATSAYLISRAALHPSTLLLLLAPIAGVRFFSALRAVARYGERVMTHDATFRVLAHLKVRIFARMAEAPPPELIGTASGDWLRRVSADIDRLERLYADGIGPVVVLVAVSALLAAWLATLLPVLAAWAAGLLLFTGGLVPWLAWRLARRGETTLVAAEARLAARLVDTMRGLADLLASGQAPRIQTQLADAADQVAGRQRQLDRVGAVASGVMTLGAQLAGWVMLGQAADAVRAGRLGGVVVAAVVLAVVAAFESVRPLAAAFPTLGESVAAGRRVLAVRGGTQRPAAGRLGPADGTVRVEELWVRYGPEQPWVLADVGFSVPAGAHVAVFGPSGGGKSSLVGVLAGLVAYQRGRVYVGGVELRVVDDKALRSALAVLLQRPYLFSATLRDNLRIARRDATDAEMWAALEAVGLRAWAEGLPERLDTPVGDLGQNLSGGERRRVALARILLAEAPIWLLDEPLAGLDGPTALAVADRLAQAAAGRTVLVVTHDPVPGWRFDTVWRMDAGRLEPAPLGSA
jgi:ATP-binding cassette subfamily C protein CydC